jgi:hypothetical protein
MMRTWRSRRVLRPGSLYFPETEKLMLNHRHLRLCGRETGKSLRCTTRAGKAQIGGRAFRRMERGLLIIGYDVGWAVTAIAIRHARAVRVWQVPAVQRPSRKV